MGWIRLGLVLLAICGSLQAQDGYNYDRPGRPFGPGTTPDRGSGGPTTAGPGGYNGNPSGGFPSTTGTGYRPTTGGFPSGPSTVQPLRPSYGPPINGGSGGAFPTTTPNYNKQRPSGSFPQGPSGGNRGYSEAGDSEGGYPSSTPSGGGYPSGVPSGGFPGTNGRSYSGATSGRFPGSTSGGFPGSSSGGFPGSSSGGFPGSFPGVQPNIGGSDDGQYDDGDYSAIPGEPGQDYPIYSEIPQTSFSCDQQQYPGYYADVEARCQVFHICANNKTYDFLCPNGTIFHQEYLVCVWWNQFDCNSAPSLYGINANIYDYSISGAGPVGYNGINNGVPGVGPQGFPSGPGAGPQGYPSGPGTTPGGRYPGSGLQGYPSGPRTTGNGPQGYPSGPGTTPEGGYPSGGPQGYPSGRGTTPSGGGYPSGGLQNYPSEPQIPGSGPKGYPSGPGRTPGGGYPSGGPQAYPSGPRTPSDRPQGYPSGPGTTPGGSYPGGSRAGTGGVTPSGGSPSRPDGDGYPSGRPSIPFPGTKTQQPTREYLPPDNGK